MTAGVLYKYFDDGRCFSNLSLASGDRIFLSIATPGFAIFRMYLGGRIPGTRIFAAETAEATRMARVLARDSTLPPLPRATQLHRDNSSMNLLLDAAINDLTAVGRHERVPGAVEALDVDNPPERPLSLFTRFALTAQDRADCARLFERLRNTPG